jgi:hypothetical protein
MVVNDGWSKTKIWQEDHDRRHSRQQALVIERVDMMVGVRAKMGRSVDG